MVGMKLLVKKSYGRSYDSALDGIRLYCNNTNVLDSDSDFVDPGWIPEGRQELSSKEGRTIGALLQPYVGTEREMGIVGVWVRSQELQQGPSDDGAIGCEPEGDNMAATDVKFRDESGKQHKPGEKKLMVSQS